MCVFHHSLPKFRSSVEVQPFCTRCHVTWRIASPRFSLNPTLSVAEPHVAVILYYYFDSHNYFVHVVIHPSWLCRCVIGTQVICIGSELKRHIRNKESIHKTLRSASDGSRPSTVESDVCTGRPAVQVRSSQAHQCQWQSQTCSAHLAVIKVTARKAIKF